MCFGLWSPAQSDLKQHLTDQYKGKVLILRGFYSGHRLTYDSSGHLLDDAAPGDWTVDGLVRIRDIRLSGSHLKIDAPRMHMGWPNGSFQEMHDKVGQFTREEKDNRALTIEADLGSASSDAADGILSQVFLTVADDFAALVPDYWKACVRAAVTGGATREVSSCKFSPEFMAVPGVAHSEKEVIADPSVRSEFTPLNRVTSPPRATSSPQPEFTDEARRAKYQGTSTLLITVTQSGEVRDVQIQRPLGMGLDRKAVEIVSTWQFKPALKDGEPVDFTLMVEVDFHLY
ncbi:MAG TPA: energy transducer TonB [Candidatus Binatia bacterium]|nr:energy transducer TonB [Candidatus Binatia bacterium]